jgi:O-acetyl-ADP-ribose deacetylase (regulator of RNase III)
MGFAMVRLHLVDSDPLVAAALAEAFASHAEVVVEHGDLLRAAKYAVVSPANSYGFMDGGIDLAFANLFGLGLERRVLEVIALRPEGHLPVGASAVVLTKHPRIPYLILAPTMLMPEHVDAQNAYRALRAVLRLTASDPLRAGPVYCPGLTTGVGGVSAVEAAKEMVAAYQDWKKALPR